MQKYKKIIFEKNKMPVISILILLIANWILGITITDYYEKIFLLTFIIVVSSALLMYYTSILNFDDTIKYKVFAVTSLLDFVIFTYFIFNEFIGSENAFKLSYILLIFFNLIYISIKPMYTLMSMKIFIGIIFLIVKVSLLILIVSSLSLAGGL